jgi:hypothetical protein
MLFIGVETTQATNEYLQVPLFRSICIHNTIQCIENDLYNNTAAHATATNPAVVYVQNDASIQFYHNFFDNPSSSYELWMDTAYNVNNKINASLNYWRATTENEIALRIYDFTDNTNKLEVLVKPWLMSRYIK